MGEKMSTLNKLTLIGRVGKHPETRHTQAGKNVVSFSLATGNSYTNKNTGEKVDNTQWHNIVVLQDNLCKVCAQYVEKGSQLYVEGELRTRKYTDKDGIERLSVEVVVSYEGKIVLLGNKQAAGGYDAGVAVSAPAIINDDIPF